MLLYILINMVLYICKENNTDISLTNVEFGKEMSVNTETTGSINISVVAAATDNGLFITPHALPNSDSWESGGTLTFLMNVTATNGGGVNWRARCRVQRRNSNGIILQDGTNTAYQSIGSTGIKTFSITIPTWTAIDEACSNRLVVVIQFNNNTAATRTCTIETGTANASADSPITENSSNCRRVFIA
jgi:hypothetical protein